MRNHVDVLWYYQTVNYNGKNTGLDSALRDLDANNFNDRQGAMNGLISTFIGWMDEEFPSWNGDAVVDTIEDKLAPFDVSREAGLRIDFILQTLQAFADANMPPESIFDDLFTEAIEDDDDIVTFDGGLNNDDDPFDPFSPISDAPTLPPSIFGNNDNQQDGNQQ